VLRICWLACLLSLTAVLLMSQHFAMTLIDFCILVLSRGYWNEKNNNARRNFDSQSTDLR
jgi:hypothetical protein